MGGTGNISFINRILDENLNPILTHNMDMVLTKGFPLVPLRKGTYTLEIDGNSNGELEYFGLYFSLIENGKTEKETNTTQKTASPLTINNDMYSTMGADIIDYYSFKWDKIGNAR